MTSMEFLFLPVNLTHWLTLLKSNIFILVLAQISLLLEWCTLLDKCDQLQNTASHMGQMVRSFITTLLLPNKILAYFLFTLQQNADTMTSIQSM